MQKLAIATLACLSLFSCANTSAESDWTQPEPFVTWHWQLQGNLNTSYNTEVYDIDLFKTSTSVIQQLQASGKEVICYFSAGSYEDWRTDANQFQASDLGNTLSGWPDERWLDIRSNNVRSIMANRLELASEKGCDGVEPDNVDGYTNNSGLPLTAADQLDFNRFIANEAHARGLAVGLKNDLNQVSALVNYFDFAVNEQCFEFDECDLLAPFINQGKAVMNVEYSSLYINNAEARESLCEDSEDRQFSTLFLPEDLDDSYRLSCF